MFRTPIDICNRALQHVGAQRIIAFTDNSRQAAECSFCYDKLRRAELRRNTWQFAIRRAVLRPMESPILSGIGFAAVSAPATPTMFLSPGLYAPTTTYFPGQIVSDSSGILWMNNTNDNIGNTPGTSSSWEQYFGPITVQPYDPTTSYFAGELLYNTIGDGVFRTYMSLVNGNTDNPTVPSLWGASTYYFKDQIVILYPNWAIGTTYAAGAAVLFTDGNYYASVAAGNIGNTPSTSSLWAQIPPGPSAQTPTASPILEWSSTTVYAVGNIVDYGGVLYVSIVANNSNNNPATSALSWSALTGGTLYLSLIDANFNNRPDLSPLVWTTSFVGGTSSHTFTPLTTALTDLPIFYPIGAGPMSQSMTRNVYRLPANFLRPTVQDPSAGKTSILGAPENVQARDWTYENDYLVTWENRAIPFRFVADMADVTRFDDMFCEGLACRIALEICEILTQSAAKLQVIAQQYQKFMTEARLANGILTGPVEPPLDDFIAARF